MASCSTATLLQSGKCFDCLTPGQFWPIKLALLCQILQARNPGADCSVPSLMRNAWCFSCLTYPQLQIIKLAMLCQIWKGAGIPEKAPVSPIILSTVRGGNAGFPTITLTWQLLDNLADTTQVWVSVNGGNYQFVATIVPPFTSYVDYGQGGAGYDILQNICYKVRACNEVGCSDFSNISCQAPLFPGAPTNLVSPPSVFGFPIHITWQLPDALGTRIELWSSKNGSAYSLLRKLSAGVTSFSDNGPYSSGDNICYKVKSCNSAGCSAFSNIDCTQVILP